MTIQECYVALGGSYEQVARRLPSAGMVERFLARFPGDDSFAKLCAGMECGRREEAFRAAHTLKGVCDHLGLDRLMDSAGRLTELLRPSQEALKDRAFFEESTVLTLYTIAGAISALANTDSISKVSADYTVDGDISLGIKGSAQVTLRVKDHHFTTIKAPCPNPRAIMEFATIDLAAGLFAGKVSTINEMCKGTIYLRGMISMLDNVNRILDRVSVYLA